MPIYESVPQPALSVPPDVIDAASVLGNQQRYAKADHTHASKVRKERLVTNTNVGTITWTYPVLFGAGVVPNVNGIAQCAAGVTDLVNVQVEGAPTNIQCVFRITRYSRAFLSLLGIDILGFNSGSLATTIHAEAWEP